MANIINVSSKKNHKKLIIAIFIVVVVSALVVMFFPRIKEAYYNVSDKTKKDTAFVCSEDQIRRAAFLMSVTSDEAKVAMDQIKSTTDFEKDPNCLFAVARYYMAISDQINAQKYMDILDDRIDGPIPMRSEIGVSRTSIDVLRYSISIIDENLESTDRG